MKKKRKKKDLSPEQIQKQWHKALRIWRDIHEHIRIIESPNGQFRVQERKWDPFIGWGEWEHVNEFGFLKHALKKKHSYIVMILMRELGYRNEFVRRRTERKKRKGQS